MFDGGCGARRGELNFQFLALRRSESSQWRVSRVLIDDG